MKWRVHTRRDAGTRCTNLISTGLALRQASDVCDVSSDQYRTGKTCDYDDPYYEGLDAPLYRLMAR